MRIECRYCDQAIEVEGEGHGHMTCPTCGSDLSLPPPGIAPGKVLGDFRLEKHIGSGSMGHVFVAEQLTLARKVAVKTFSRQYAPDDEALHRFLTEMRLVAALDHPSIVTAFSAGEQDGICYLAMSLVEGLDLDQMLKKDKVLPEKQALDIVRKMAEALRYAWNSKHILHRDIKPSNIKLTAAGEPMLLDLGIAKTHGDQSDITQDGYVLGTPFYMSPEQAGGKTELDCRSDIYSLGATLYHLTVGHPPFEHENATTVLSMQIHAPLPDPRERNPALSEETARLLTRMMAKDRNDRPADWDELVPLIERTQADLKRRAAHGKTAVPRKVTVHLDPAVKAALHASVPPVSAPASSRRYLALGVFVVLLAILLAAGGLFFLYTYLQQQVPSPGAAVPPAGPPPAPVAVPVAMPVPAPVPPLASPPTPVPRLASPPSPLPRLASPPSPLPRLASPPSTLPRLASPLVAPAAAAADPALEQRRQWRQRFDKLAAKAKGEPAAALEAMHELERLGEEAAADGDLRAQIDRQRAQIEQRLRSQATEVLRQLDREARALSDSGKWDQAVKLVREYRGAAAELTAPERAKLADRLQAEGRKRQDPGHLAQVARKRLDLLCGELAELLASNRLADARARIDLASRDKALNPVADQLNALLAQVAEACAMDELLAASFKAQEGQTVRLRDGDSQRDLKIVRIEGANVYHEAQERHLGLVLKRLDLGSLDVRERYRRLGADKTRQLGLLRGLLMIEANRPDLAAARFREAGGILADGFLARLQQAPPAEGTAEN